MKIILGLKMSKYCLKQNHAAGVSEKCIDVSDEEKMKEK